MEMHKVEYEFQLTGSQLFDMVMYNTAKQLCGDFPGRQMSRSILTRNTKARS